MQLTTSNEHDALHAIRGAGHLAESTKAKYTRAVEHAVDAGVDLYDAEQLAEYAQGLSNSGRAFLKAAVRLVTDQIVNDAKSQAEPGNVAAVQAIAYRVEALQNAIETTTPKGSKAHTWLSQAQVKRLLDSCGDDLKGRRDRLALGLMVAAGLRRSEAVNLRFSDVVYKPVGDRFRCVLAVEGKGRKRREVPISDALATAIDEWGRVVDHQGRVLRSFTRRREVNGSMSSAALFNLVREYGAAIGKPELACHDLRRSYAQLGFEAGVPITQISRLLGHSSVAVTQRYLNCDLDLESTVSDFVPF